MLRSTEMVAKPFRFPSKASRVPPKNSLTENARLSDSLMPGSPKGRIACLSKVRPESAKLLYT